jgi:hypothetical protein
MHPAFEAAHELMSGVKGYHLTVNPNATDAVSHLGHAMEFIALVMSWGKGCWKTFINNANNEHFYFAT